MSRQIYQRSLPIAIASIFALIILLHFFVAPIDEITAARSEILIWSSLCVAFGILVGAVGLLWLHVSRARSRELTTTTRVYGVVTIAVTVLFVVVGVSFKGFTGSTEYVLINTHILTALANSVRAVAFFSILVGIYSAFRIRNVDSLILCAAGSIYLLRSFAAGQSLLPPIIGIADWLSQVPNVGATRGALVAAAAGALVLAVRVFIGKEKAVTEIIESEGV